MAEALWRQDRRWEASEYYQQVLADLPYSLKANLIQGALLLQGGRPDEARPHLERARALDPENVLAGRLFGEHSPLRPEPVHIARLGEVLAPEPPPLHVPTPISPEMPAIEPESAPPEPAVLPEGAVEREPSLESPPETPISEVPAMEPDVEPVHAEPEPVPQDEPTWLVSLEQKAQSQAGGGQVAEGIPDWLLGLRGLSHETEPSPPAETREEVAEPEPVEAEEEWAPVTDAEIAQLDTEPSVPEPEAEPLPAWPARVPTEEPPPTEPAELVAEAESEPPTVPEIGEPEPPAWPAQPEPAAPVDGEPAFAPRSLSEPPDELGEEEPVAVTGEEAELLWPTAPEAPTAAPTEPEEREPPSPIAAEEIPEMVPADSVSVEPVEEAPEDTESLLQVARSHLEAGNVDGSVEHYHRLVHGPAGVPAEAVEDLEDLVQRASDQLEIQQLLGDAYMRTGRLQEALHLYREVRSQLVPG